MRKVADKSYLPTNFALQSLLERHENFRVALSISGTALEQMQLWAPDALESFQRLVATGKVELVGETYHHSLAFFYDRGEFEHQVELHRSIILDLFGVEPQIFRNTELSYNNDVAYWADQAGYKGILTEGWDPVLGWRSPNYLYRPVYTKDIRVMLKNYRLSDDIAFRFSNHDWTEWPLTADKYVSWVENQDQRETNLNLFMDYETFGEHQWGETGIYDFLEHFVGQWLSNPERSFMTPSELIDSFEPVDHLDVPQTITWADTERDLSAWLGNRMQQEAVQWLYSLKDRVLASADAGLIEDWRRLQTSDHFYYMCTKWFNDGDIHAYFSPYDSPYNAYMYYQNVLRDMEVRLAQLGAEV
jgi:alpha-amylase